MSNENIAKSLADANVNQNGKQSRTLSHLLARDMTSEEINAVAGSLKKGPVTGNPYSPNHDNEGG